ncbi:zinc finger protein 532 isoform X1 [Gadus chalcogrammus]|uniref:zinc finger protein 532 isoform X1 n=2 Tax=Gadus chalcogrammus TaxID=1042646 RepID=UPI0024C4C3C0|nr:zinc finger protein 532 isoform X1 [Gadus chalcogrammus]
MKPSSGLDQGTMADMKTPDFDDLLAAFDIPDMVDPKAAIESGQNDDHEGPLKQANGGRGGATSEDGPLSAHDVGVSVIVKNVRSADAGEQDGSLQKNVRKSHNPRHAHDPHGNGVHYGLLQATASAIKLDSKNGWRVPMEESPSANATTLTIHQFSPISSAEEFDDDDRIEVDEPTVMNCSQPLFRPTPNTFAVHPSCPKKEEQNRRLPTLVDFDSKLRATRNLGQTKAEANNKYGTLNNTKPTDTSKAKPEVQAKQEGINPQAQEGKEAVELSGSSSDLSVSQAKAKTSAKLSSCIAAIAALSAKKTSSRPPRGSDRPTIQKESIAVSPRGESPKVAKESPGPPERQSKQESALEVAKRLLSREPDSPCSVTSECSSKESPASPTGTTPVIPKVRIKTIKTSSGQIKRTVTRVLPEVDAEGKSGEDSNNLTAMVSSALSPTTSNTVSPSPRKDSLPNTVLAGRRSLEVTRHMTIKPVATAFLPVSAVNKAGSQVINLKLANNTTVKATVIPASSLQSASSAIRRAANATQQQTVMVPNSSLANAKLVPKTVHLTNLNLLPKAASNTTCEIQQAAPGKKIKQQQVKPQTAKAGQLPKKVSRVQVLSSTQSTVVEAFNKVLSSINPVPVYVPNLSPPTSACISLPSRGYKCLECGDSFALDKSLSQHFERRSVRIEVTCNHCAKSLVFYNKCSLLSHARGHKDKGAVMQCSHLILKPIPTNQMTHTSPPVGPCGAASAPVSTGPTVNLATTVSQAKATSAGAPMAVISAPSGSPLVAAMPLEDDGTKQCRQCLKCLECNEMFLDESSLVIHYQQAVEINAQKTCSVCQMLLPNQCSFVSHQRIHQHKSPFICPECGTSCRSVHFQSHITKNCLHYTRRVGYRCVHCSVIFGDAASLKSHIQNTHCEVFYKCPMCPMAFKSAQAIHSHGYTQHPGAKLAEPKLIYKCSMCDTVFTLQSLLNSHFDQHVGSHKVSVFKCPDCSSLYAQKQLLLDHIKITHGTLKTIEGPPNLGINLPLSTKPTHSNSNNNNNNNSSSNKDGGHANLPGKKPGPLSLKTTNSHCNSGDHRGPQGPQVYTCGDCDGVFTTREGFVSHVRRDHGKILKKHPCRQCDKSFSSSHSLCRHNRLKHKGLRKIYTCPHCPPLSQPFPKRVLLDQHIQLMHDVKEPESKSQEPADVEPQPNKAASSKRKPEEEEEGDGEGSPGLHPRGAHGPQPPPVKKPKVQLPKALQCAVCGFCGAADPAAFRLHIPQHKTDGSSHQCQECGLCYTSHRSLARHLFIVHRLKDHHNLARRGRTDAASAADEEDGEGDGPSGRENQSDVRDENDRGLPGPRCKVCRKVFDTEGHLNSHMRTHGMAFIKAKRLSAAEK